MRVMVTVGVCVCDRVCVELVVPVWVGLDVGLAVWVCVRVCVCDRVCVWLAVGDRLTVRDCDAVRVCV